MLLPAPFRQRLFSHCLAVFLLCAVACNRTAKSGTNDADQTSASKSLPAEIWKQFNGERAFEDVKTQTGFGPRPAGSPALAQAREHLQKSLSAAGWSSEVQAFTANTPHGAVQMSNVIARFTGGKGQSPDLSKQKVVLGSHYDTKIFSTISFVGANDGASSTGALLELARVLAGHAALASQVELVFFDGEEAVQQFTETDGLYGSRHYATTLRESGRNLQFKYGIVLDMIGDKDLTVTLPLDSPKELTQGLMASADALQTRRHFRIFDRPMLDDHVPLNQIARIPTIDLIDFDYAPWHTADDTLEQLSPASLQTIGAIVLHYLKSTLP